MADAATRPAGIEGLDVAGPFAVGAYAAKLRDELAKRARVQLFGEVFNVRSSKAKLYFELRDAGGALPCAIWRNEFEQLGVELADGAQIVVAGGPAYYTGSRTSSPSFSFEVTGIRLAGEGDLLAQLAALRRQLGDEGLFEPQKALRRASLPRCIGVVTGEGGKARDDVLAGLRRRGWGGRLVWAFVPVQDRHAAPRITQALQDLAAIEEVDVIIVARGGGSLADLFAFCDEGLCRTVALLRTPVIASVGHHTDRPSSTMSRPCPARRRRTPPKALCRWTSTPPRAGIERLATRLAHHRRLAIPGRARHLAQLARGSRSRDRTAARTAAPEVARGPRQRATRRYANGARAAASTRSCSHARHPRPRVASDRSGRRSSAGLALGAGRARPRARARAWLCRRRRWRRRDPHTAEAARAAGYVRISFSDAALRARIEP